MSDFKEWSDLILTEMKRQDNKHRDIMGELKDLKKEQIEQGKTLVRNTTSLEEHMRRTHLLEAKTEHIETEVDGLREHVDKINFILQLLKPTKEKIKWFIIISMLLSGSYGGYKLTDNESIKKIINIIITPIK
jgi:hypothetical protein